MRKINKKSYRIYTYHRMWFKFWFSITCVPKNLKEEAIKEAERLNHFYKFSRSENITTIKIPGGKRISI